MELVPLFPREPEEGEDAPSKKKSKKKSNNNEEEDQAESSEDDANPNKKKKAKKAGGTKKDVPKSAASAKSYCLRSLLPAAVIAKAIKPSPFDPEAEERHLLDLKGAVGEAGMQREGLKEWKLGRDEVIDWRRGSEQRTLMGILNVVLALIMVNERVLTDGAIYTTLL